MILVFRIGISGETTYFFRFICFVALPSLFVRSFILFSLHCTESYWIFSLFSPCFSPLCSKCFSTFACFANIIVALCHKNQHRFRFWCFSLHCYYPAAAFTTHSHRDGKYCRVFPQFQNRKEKKNRFTFDKVFCTCLECNQTNFINSRMKWSESKDLYIYLLKINLTGTCTRSCIALVAMPVEKFRLTGTPRTIEWDRSRINNMKTEKSYMAPHYRHRVCLYCFFLLGAQHNQFTELTLAKIFNPNLVN